MQFLHQKLGFQSAHRISVISNLKTNESYSTNGNDDFLFGLIQITELMSKTYFETVCNSDTDLSTF